MCKHDKPMMIGVTLIFTAILVPLAGWPAIVFGGFVIAGILFSGNGE